MSSAWGDWTKLLHNLPICIPCCKICQLCFLYNMEVFEPVIHRGRRITHGETLPHQQSSLSLGLHCRMDCYGGCLEARILGPGGLHVNLQFVTEDSFCVAVLLPTRWIVLITTMESSACRAGLSTFIEVQQVDCFHCAMHSEEQSFCWLIT